MKKVALKWTGDSEKDPYVISWIRMMEAKGVEDIKRVAKDYVAPAIALVYATVFENE